MSEGRATALVDLPGEWFGLPEGSRAVLEMAETELAAADWLSSLEVGRAVRVSLPEDAPWGPALREYSGDLSIRALTGPAAALPTAVLARGECASAEIPPGQSALERLRACGEAGVPARLADLDLWPGPDLAAALDFYITCPTLESPVEPWHSLAQAVSGGWPCDLWHAEEAVVGRNIYISVQGLATLSARFDRRERWFGAGGEGLEGWRGSALWRELEGYRRALFRTRAECAFCAAFPWCGGFWVAPGLEDHERCEVWRGLMAHLAKMAREAGASATSSTNPMGTPCGRGTS